MAKKKLNENEMEVLKADGTRRVHIGTAVRYVFEHTSYVKVKTTKKKAKQAA